MTTRDSRWPQGTPCWVDLAVDDLATARTFYSRLFGWEVEEGSAEHGGYANCLQDGRRVAGMAPKQDSSQPTAWTTYLASDDVDATLAKAREAGGQVLVEATDVPGIGRFALISDPGGAVTGLWQGGSHLGFERANEPGSVTWNEQLSRAWRQCQDFYAAVVGWTYDDMSGEGFDYAVFKVAGEVAGGIGEIAPPLPDDLPPHWATYFKVDDTDATVAELRRLGGSVAREPWDTEFGRMAAVEDDQGAFFLVMADLG